MLLYPDTFKPERKEHFQGWINLYNDALGSNWNYDKLMKLFARNYKSVVTPPHPSFFLDFQQDVVIIKPKIEKKIEMTEEEKRAAEEAHARFRKKLEEKLREMGKCMK